MGDRPADPFRQPPRSTDVTPTGNTIDGMLNLIDELTWIAEDSLVFSEDAPFRADLTVAHPRLVVITGENASGKSLAVRVLAGRAHEHKLTAVSVSIRERAGSGEHEMARFAQAMMFGDQNDQSTGAVSARSVNNLLTRNLDRKEGALGILDEPELGLSDGYARAMGELIGSHADTLPKTCAGVVVVTHSRALVAGLLERCPDPTWMPVVPRPSAGDLAPAGPGTLQEWATGTEERTVEELLALQDAGHARWLAVRALLKPTR